MVFARYLSERLESGLRSSPRASRVVILLASAIATMILAQTECAPGSYWAGNLMPFVASMLSLIFLSLLLPFLPACRSEFQSAALLLAFVIYRLYLPTADSVAWNLLFPFVLIVAARFLPFQNKAVYVSAIVISLMSIPAVFLATDYTQGWSLYILHRTVFLCTSSVTAFLLVVHAIRHSESEQSWHTVFRPMVVAFCSGGPFAVRESLAEDFSDRTFLKGAGLMVVTVIGVYLQAKMFPLPLNPAGALAKGELLYSMVLAAGRWSRGMAGILGTFAGICACANFLGIPLTFPVTQPWLATNFVEYWKRANTARYEFFQKIFWSFGSGSRLRTAIPRVMGIFLISGLLHLYHGSAKAAFSRWTLEGFLTCLSIVLLHHSSRRRLDYFAKHGHKKPESNGLGAWTLQQSKRLAVIIMHGFLYEMDGR